MSLDDFKVTADEMNNPPDLVDKERMCVEVAFPVTKYSVKIIIDKKTGRVVSINNMDVEDRLYNPKFMDTFINEAIDELSNKAKGD